MAANHFRRNLLLEDRNLDLTPLQVETRGYYTDQDQTFDRPQESKQHKYRNLSKNHQERKKPKGLLQTSPKPIQDSIWLTLPPEIWSQAFSYLTQKDHLSLSGVCKTLHGIVEPDLYSRFSWMPDARFPPPFVWLLNNQNIANLSRTRREKRARIYGKFGPKPLLLLRTLLNAPELGKHFKHARFLAVDCECGMFTTLREAREGYFTGREFEQCQKIIIGRKTLSQENWLQGLKYGRLDVTLGLLLSQMTCLSSLEIRLRGNGEGSPPLTSGNTLFEILSDSVLAPGPQDAGLNSPLHQLKFLKVSVDEDDESAVEWYHDEDAIDIHHQVPALLRFPELQSVNIVCFSPEVIIFKNPQPSNKMLKRLRLTAGDLNERQLDQVVKTTPYLEDLEFDLMYFEDQDLDGRKLNEVLTRVAGTLVRLAFRINIISVDNGNSDVWDVEYLLGSLKHFTKLQELEIPTITLLSDEKLSQNDESLGAVLEGLLPDSLTALFMHQYPAIDDHYTRTAAERTIEDYLRKRPALSRNFERNVMGRRIDLIWGEVVSVTRTW